MEGLRKIEWIAALGALGLFAAARPTDAQARELRAVYRVQALAVYRI